MHFAFTVYRVDLIMLRFVTLNEQSLVNTQRADIKNLFQNVMILQRELCLCNFHIIYWLLYNKYAGQLRLC